LTEATDLSALERFLNDFDLYLTVYERIEGRDESKLTERLLDVGRGVRQGTRSWTKSDLVGIVRWKRLYRHMPRIEKNPESEVDERLRFAFMTEEERLRIEILFLISGVGAALASAILMFTFPERFGVFDFHAYNALKHLRYWRPKKKPGDFRARELLDYFDVLRSLAESKRTTAREADKALYSSDKVKTDKRWKDIFNLIQDQRRTM
jgi:hypothetical protein